MLPWGDGTGAAPARWWDAPWGWGCTSTSPVPSRAFGCQCPGTDRPKGKAWSPACMGRWPPNLPLPSAFSQQQSAVSDVPDAFLSRMAQLSPGLAPGSSPSQAVPAPLAGTQPGPLLVPKAERLSPTSACGESGAPQGAPQDTAFPAGSLNKILWECFISASIPAIYIYPAEHGRFLSTGEGTAPSPASFYRGKSRNRKRQKGAKCQTVVLKTQILVLKWKAP